MMLVIVYPALYFIPGDDHGHQEDIVDTMVMFSNSRGPELSLSALPESSLGSLGLFKINP